MEKECTKCLKSLDLSEFTKDSSKKDGYYSSCKECYRIRVNKTGRRIMNDWHLGTDGYIHKGDLRQHRYVVEEHLGRKLLKSEHVHHINHDKTDNRLENLVVLNQSEHHRVHTGKSKKGFYKTCMMCGIIKYHHPCKLKHVSKSQYRCIDCYRSTHITRNRLKTDGKL